jgi:hypothetical protein
LFRYECIFHHGDNHDVAERPFNEVLHTAWHCGTGQQPSGASHCRKPKLEHLELKTKQWRSCVPTFHGIQLVADHLLRHKGRHFYSRSNLLSVLTSGGDASTSSN